MHGKQQPREGDQRERFFKRAPSFTRIEVDGRNKTLMASKQFRQAASGSECSS